MRQAMPKTVRFSDHVVINSDYALPSTDDTQNSWWNTSELDQFRHSARLSSTDTSEKPWMMKSFERAYKRSKRIAEIFEDESILHSKMCEIKVPEELTDWCRYGHLKRGLERWSSNSHNSARGYSVSKARKRITEMNANDIIFVRQESERNSRTSRVFARLMGQADANAIRPHLHSNSGSTRAHMKPCECTQYHGIVSSPSFPAQISSRSA